MSVWLGKLRYGGECSLPDLAAGLVRENFPPTPSRESCSFDGLGQLLLSED